MPGFEEQLAELEKIVEKLEQGELTLEENVSLFERGMILSNACKKDLAAAESRIQMVLDPRESGDVRVSDLEVDSDEEDSDVEDDGRL